ncbi:MAG: PIG-L family deacetylase [Vicinamibacterales bacterium]
MALTTPTAQHQLVPVAALRGEAAVELALRKLDTVGTFMMTTAHPDDENNAMLAYYGHGKGMRTALVTATRGEGGQNEIGPELFEALAVLRTEELLAAHRYDGAEQYFTRAVDFGYSFSIEETLAKWGKEEILGDYVRMIRTLRPQVIVGFVFDGEGGGQHHQTSSRLTAEAFLAAADPARFPEQIAEGLRPWQASKFYYTAGFGPGGPGGPGGRTIQLTGPGASSPLMFDGGNDYDWVLGRTYNEIAGEARSMHKCQGMSQLLPLPGAGGAMGPGSIRAYRLYETVLPDGVNRQESDPFDGVDVSLASLAAYAGATPPAALTSALATITGHVRSARESLARGAGATVPSLASGLTAVRTLRADLKGMGLGDAAQYDIDFRLAQKESQFISALVAATDMRIEAIANDGVVTPGQNVGVQMIAVSRGSVPVEVVSRELHGFDQPTEKGGVIPADARMTAAHFRYATDASRFILDPDVPFGLPFRPTPFTALFTVKAGGVEFPVTVPVQARSEGNLFSGEKRAEVHVVPAFAVTASPDTLIVPTHTVVNTAAGAGAGGKEIRVTVVNHAKGAAAGDVTLQMPEGWTATPPTQAVSLSREDEAITVRFVVRAPSTAALSTAASKPGGSTFRSRRWSPPAERRTTRAISSSSPHTTRRQVRQAPVVTAKALDVSVKPNLKVGYVMGVGDEVPAALEQLGVEVSLIGSDELAWGDLSKIRRRHDGRAGIRAPARSARLQPSPPRLREGGRHRHRQLQQVRVQRRAVRAVSGARGPRTGDRRERRGAAARAEEPGVQQPEPDRTCRLDRVGQERGLLSFLDTDKRDPRMKDLVEFEEPFAYNGRQARRAGGGRSGQGPLDLRGPGSLAPASGRYRRRVSVDGQPAQHGWLAGAVVRHGRRVRPAARSLLT